MSTHAQVPAGQVGRPHVNPWLFAVVALSAALVGLVTWVIIDQTRPKTVTAKPATRGLASAGTVTMLKDRIAAVNGGNANAISAFYTPDAVLEEHDVTPAIVTKGGPEIGHRIRVIVTQFGMRLRRTSPVIRFGQTVAEATRVPGSTTGFILVYALGANGKIAHQWVLPAE